MANLQQQISEARGRGYSDDEIVSYLGGAHADLAPKIKEAQGAGYGAGDILGHLSAQGPRTAAEKFGVTNPIGKGALDALEGIGAGVMSTVRGVSQLAHKAIPAIPEVPAEYADAPDSLMGKAGKFAEQATEFAVPAGMAAKATKGLGLLARTAGQAAAGGVTAAVQTGGDPSGTVAGTAAGAAGPVLGAALGKVAKAADLPRKLYQSALKPSLAKTAPKPAKIVATGLREGIPVSREGFVQSAEKIGELNDEIAGKLASVDENVGAAINPRDVAKRIKDSRPRFESVNPEADQAALSDAKAEFLRSRTTKVPYTKLVPSVEEGAGLTPGGTGFMEYLQNLTPLEAQNLKQGTYRVLGDKAFTGELKAAAVEGQKALARGLKEEIEAVFPEIKSLNAREGSLIELQNALERFVAREANHQLTGIGTPLMATAGALTGGAHAGLALGVARGVLEAPAIKSKIAIALTRAGSGRLATLPTINNRLAALKGSIEAAVSKMAADHGQPTEGLTPELAQ